MANGFHKIKKNAFVKLKLWAPSDSHKFQRNTPITLTDEPCRLTDRRVQFPRNPVILCFLSRMHKIAFVFASLLRRGIYTRLNALLKPSHTYVAITYS
jgi:hypothetical protein